MTMLSERLALAMRGPPQVSKADLARACGIKPPSVSDWFNGRTKNLEGKNLILAARKLNVRPEWLAGEGGPMRAQVQGSGESTSPPLDHWTGNSQEPASTSDNGYRVTQLDAAGSMGGGVTNDDYPDAIREVEFDPAYIRALIGFVPLPGRLKLITGRGDSMVPTIQPGDVVLIDTGCEQFDGDGIYLIDTGDGAQIKRLQAMADGVYVLSSNPDYRDFKAPKRTRIGGRVYLRNRLDRLA